MPVIEVRHPLVRHKIGLLREHDISTKKFRELTNELARLLTYEATADFPLEKTTVQCWSGPAEVERISGKKVTVVPILRAGLGMQEGVLDLIPSAKVSVVGLARNHETLQPENYFERFVGQLAERTAIIIDPMLATAGSMIATVDAAEGARLHRHPRAGAGGRAGGHRRARTRAPGRALLDGGDRQPPQRGRLHHPGPRRRRRQDLRDEMKAHVKAHGGQEFTNLNVKCLAHVMPAPSLAGMNKIPFVHRLRRLHGGVFAPLEVRRPFRLWMTGSLAVVMAASIPIRDVDDVERSGTMRVLRHSRLGVVETLQRLESAARNAGLSTLAVMPGARAVLVLASSVGGTPVLMEKADSAPTMPLGLLVRAGSAGGADILVASMAMRRVALAAPELPRAVADELGRLPILVDQALT